MTLEAPKSKGKPRGSKREGVFASRNGKPGPWSRFAVSGYKNALPFGPSGFSFRASRGHFGASRGHFGALRSSSCLGGSFWSLGGHFGASGGHLSALGSHLRACLPPFDPFWLSFGSFRLLLILLCFFLLSLSVARLLALLFNLWDPCSFEPRITKLFWDNAKIKIVFIKQHVALPLAPV